MSSPEIPRDELVAAVLRATAEMSSGRLAFSQGVAERFGLATSDIECLQLLAADGAMPVGRLGELTALTTGATTRMVDRLEQAGYVRRVADPADRRRVIVEPVEERTLAISRAFVPLDDDARRALGDATAGELGAIRSYLEASVATLRDGTARLRADAPSSDTAGSAAAPVASATQGRLVFVTGAPSISITGDPAMGRELYRARFEGAVGSARVRDGIVTIRYPRFAWFDWRARVADQWLEASAHWRRNVTTLALNATLPWEVELRGGATAVRADFREVALRGFDLRGGTGIVALSLPRPAGVVQIRARGGIGDATIVRPKGVAVRLSVRGGSRSATLDGVAAWSGGRIDTPGAEAVPDRYEIEIAGGANNVVVTAE